MDIPKVEKKQREAQFFLGKMIEQEKKAFGDKEPFDFYLSAFLNATRTIDYRLRYEQKTSYTNWRKAWDLKLKNNAPDDKRLMKFMVDDRNIEVHESGSGRNVAMEDTEITGNRYSDESGTAQIVAAPGTPRSTIQKPAYFFSIDGNDRKATEAFGKYLALLDRMVAEFKSHNP